MRIKFTFLSILLFTIIFIVAPFDTIKATNNVKSTTTIAEFKDEKFDVYHQHGFIPHKSFRLCNSSLNYSKDRNVIVIFKNIIKFIQENILVIIFLIWAIISIKRTIHNCAIKKKYKRDNNKYEVKRNEKEGDEKERNTIYLVCKEKNNEDKFVYHHIINMYTLVNLGYTRPSKKDEDCFSTKDKEYIMGENIIIYNITFDFRKIDN